MFTNFNRSNDHGSDFSWVSDLYSVFGGNTPPVVSTHQENGDYLYQIALPGYTRDDVSITLSGDTVEISGKKKAFIADFKLAYSIRGLKLGDASMRDGVLSIVFHPETRKDVQQIAIRQD